MHDEVHRALVSGAPGSVLCQVLLGVVMHLASSCILRRQLHSWGPELYPLQLLKACHSVVCVPQWPFCQGLHTGVRAQCYHMFVRVGWHLLPEWCVHGAACCLL